MGPGYKEFIANVAKRAAAAQNVGERYALGSKTVSIPIDGSGEFGFKAGVIECRITFPVYSKESPNTGSTIQLAREIEAHISLILNALEKATGNNDGYADIKKQVFEQLNKEILIEQLIWLGEKTEKKLTRENISSLDNQSLASIAINTFKYFIEITPNGQVEFNQFLASKRLEFAQKYRDETIHQLFIRGLLDTTQNITGIIENAIKQLAKTPSTFSDTIFQSSATGEFFSTTATHHVAHDKQLGADQVAAVRIVTPGDKVVWRVPSLAATDAYKKIGRLSYNENQFVVDIKNKLGYLSEKILKEENGGDKNDHLYYNLLTSYGSGPLADNHQDWSTCVIIKGVHQFNKDKQNQDEKTPLVLIINLAVNQWNEQKRKPPEENPANRKVVDEIFDLADLSMLQLLTKQLCGKRILAEKDQAFLSDCANESLQNYRAFLRTGTAPYYTNDRHSNAQRMAIDNLRDKINVDTLDAAALNAKTPEEKASLSLLKMFINGTYAERGYGMLMQALMLATETNKMSGCKSANERFASVVDKSIHVRNPLFMQAMDKFLRNEIHESQLYSELVTLYNNNNIYEGPGQDCSIRDQGATAKAGQFEGAAVKVASPVSQSKTGRNSPTDSDDEEYTDKNLNMTYDTNCFEPPTLTHLQQKNAKKLQAHNVEAAVESSFIEGKNKQEKIIKEKSSLIAESDSYSLDQYAKKQSTQPGESSPNLSSANLSSVGSLKKRLSMVVFSNTLSPDKIQEREFKESAGLTLYSCLKFIENYTPPVKIPLTVETVEKINSIHIVLIKLERECSQIKKTDLTDLIPRVKALCEEYEKAFPEQQIPLASAQQITLKMLERANNHVDEMKLAHQHHTTSSNLKP
ncbi:MAG: hypothetical protein ACHQAX_07995 [Gammaproteobacteria bacterium]